MFARRADTAPRLSKCAGWDLGMYAVFRGFSRKLSTLEGGTYTRVYVYVYAVKTSCIRCVYVTQTGVCV